MTKSRTKTNGKATPPAPENLDRVRELLFGPQLEAVDSKITAVEQRLTSDLNALSEQLSSGLESLERFSRTELDGLSQRASEERDQREEREAELRSEISQVSRNLEKKISALGERLSEVERRLRQQFRDDLRAHQQQSQNQLDELTRSLRSVQRELTSDKVSRTTLAGFFRDVAAQLDQSHRLDLGDLVEAAQAEEAADAE